MRQILIAGAFALIFSIFGTRVLIGALARKGYGQIIREDGPSSHHIKHGTPTMGGIIFILAAILGYLFAHVITGNPVTAADVERVYTAYRALSIENVTVSAKRDEASMFEVSFRLLPEDASGSYGKIVDRTWASNSI